MHDMGYLSQVGYASQSIRDSNGIVLPGYQNYVQKIRTPPLKGLRFNRFVTESHKNVKPADPPNPACDFLLHDGRACDAIEAAFLHDGPAIKIDLLKRQQAEACRCVMARAESHRRFNDDDGRDSGVGIWEWGFANHTVTLQRSQRGA